MHIPHQKDLQNCRIIISYYELFRQGDFPWDANEGNLCSAFYDSYTLAFIQHMLKEVLIYWSV